MQFMFYIAVDVSNHEFILAIVVIKKCNETWSLRIFVFLFWTPFHVNQPPHKIWKKLMSLEVDLEIEPICLSLKNNVPPAASKKTA